MQISCHAWKKTCNTLHVLPRGSLVKDSICKAEWLYINFNHPKYLFCYLSYTYSLEWTTIQKLVSVTTETIMNEEVNFVHLPRSFSESEQREGKYYF